MNDPVIDLSHHNPEPDWVALRAAGTVGVIHKATEGSSYVDDTLFSRAKDAMAAGLKWSTYHFLRPAEDMSVQMKHYLKTVNPVKGERVCLDHEDEGVSLQDLKNAVEYLLEDPRALQITIYSGHVIKDQLGDKRDDYLRVNTSLWIAHYTSASAPSWPKNTWDSWSLWQYTDSADFEGSDAPADGDRWNGDPEALVAWFGPAGEVEPVPPVVPDVPVVRVIAPPGVKIIVEEASNGKEPEAT